MPEKRENKKGNGKSNGHLYVLGGLALVAAAAVIMGMDEEKNEDEDDLDAGRKTPEPSVEFSAGDYDVDIIKDDDGTWKWFAVKDGDVVGAGSAMSSFDAKFQSKKWATKSTGERLKSRGRPPGDDGGDESGEEEDA
jgi:hypothetical protein